MPFLNLSFEDWTAGACDSWTKTASAGDQASWDADTAYAVKGAYAIKVGARGYASVAMIRQSIDATPFIGQIVTVTVRTYGSYTGSTIRNRLQLLTDGAVPAEDTDDNNGFSNVWTTLSATVTIPSDATTFRIGIERRWNGTSYSYGYFDNIKISGMYLTYPSPVVIAGSSVNTARVTGLVHRYDRRQGINLLEIFIGDTTSRVSLPETSAPDTAASRRAAARRLAMDIGDYIIPKGERVLRSSLHPGLTGEQLEGALKYRYPKFSFEFDYTLSPEEHIRRMGLPPLAEYRKAKRIEWAMEEIQRLRKQLVEPTGISTLGRQSRDVIGARIRELELQIDKLRE